MPAAGRRPGARGGSARFPATPPPPAHRSVMSRRDTIRPGRSPCGPRRADTVSSKKRPPRRTMSMSPSWARATAAASSGHESMAWSRKEPKIVLSFSSRESALGLASTSRPASSSTIRPSGMDSTRRVRAIGLSSRTLALKPRRISTPAAEKERLGRSRPGKGLNGATERESPAQMTMRAASISPPRREKGPGGPSTALPTSAVAARVRAKSYAPRTHQAAPCPYTA